MNNSLSFTVSILFCAVLITIPVHAISNSREDHKTDDIDRGRSCSSINLVNNGYSIFGKNLDYRPNTGGMIYINKRGVKRVGQYTSTTGSRAQWVSKYASVNFSFVHIGHVWTGMNEKGLVISMMSIPEIEGPPPDERPPLLDGMWVQYMLDTCETVEDVLQAESGYRIITRDHYHIADRYGDSAVIEYLAGVKHVYTGESLPLSALTNSTYASSIQDWNRYKEGFFPPPDGSIERFRIAAERIEDFNSTDTEDAVNYAFETLSSMSSESIYGYPNTTEWSIVFDTKNLLAYFRTHYHPVIRYFDLRDFDWLCDTPVQMLDIQEILSGDVSSEFQDVTAEAAYNHYRNYYYHWNGVLLTEREVIDEVEKYMHFPCSAKVDVDSISVSEDIAGINAKPRIAISRHSGDILVVWERKEQSTKSSSSIWSALLKRRRSNGYYVVERHQLSAESTYNANPFPIFDEGKNRFLVVWDQADPAFPDKKSDIIGKIISENGLPEKEIIPVLANRKRNKSPQLYFRIPRETSPGKNDSSEKLNLAVSTVELKKKHIEKTGLGWVLLGDDYRSVESKRLLEGGAVRLNGKKIPQEIIPQGIGQVVDQNVFLPLACQLVQSDGSVLNQSTLAVISKDDSLVARKVISEPEAKSISGLNTAAFSNPQRDTVIIVSTIRNRQAVNTVFTLKVNSGVTTVEEMFRNVVRDNTRHSIILPVLPESSKKDSISSLPGRSVACIQLFLTADGFVYSQQIGVDGLSYGSEKKVVDEKSTPDYIIGAEIILENKKGLPLASRRAEFLVIRQKRIPGKMLELRAEFFDILR